MAGFKIFTESKADGRFLIDFIDFHFKQRLPESDFDYLGSWSGYKAGGVLKTSIQENFDNGKTTLFVLDADLNMQVRRDLVLNDMIRFGIPCEIFLFPNNDDVGNRENLLVDLAVERQVIECFSNYENCIAEYQMPVTKSKIFAYLDAVLPANLKKGDKHDEIRDEKRNFLRDGLWNLAHDAAKPLVDFLSPHFPQQATVHPLN